MMTVVWKTVKNLTALIFVTVVSEFILFGGKNVIDGKTFLGRRKKPKKKTYVDVNDYVQMGSDDYNVA